MNPVLETQSAVYAGICSGCREPTVGDHLPHEMVTDDAGLRQPGVLGRREEEDERSHVQGVEISMHMAPGSMEKVSLGASHVRHANTDLVIGGRVPLVSRLMERA